MSTNKHRELCRVVRLADQLIDATIVLMIRKSRNSGQLELSLTRERALRGLQEIMHDEYGSRQLNEKQRWQVVRAIVASATAYVLETMSDWDRCNPRREQPVVLDPLVRAALGFIIVIQRQLVIPWK